MEEESMIELLHQYATKLNERVDTLETQLESLTIKTVYGQKPELETKKPELETKKPKKFFGLFGGKKPKRRIKYTYGIYTGNY